MNEDFWQTLAAQRRRVLCAIAAFGVAVCLVAVFAVHHLGVELSRQLLADLAMSQAKQLGETFGSDEEDPLRAVGKHRALIDYAARTRDHLVAVRVVDAGDAVQSLTVLPAFPGIEGQFDAGLNAADIDVQRGHCEKGIGGGAKVFLVRVPFGPSTGWFFEGFHRASPETVREINSIYATAVVLIMVTLAITVVLTYPVVRFLQSNLFNTSRNLLKANLDMLKALGCATAKRDSDTGDHNYRVTFYAVRIAEKMRLNDRAIRGLIKGALLHDVGKIAVRDAVLWKSWRLDEAELAEMRQHVAHGVEIIASDAWLPAIMKRSMDLDIPRGSAAARSRLLPGFSRWPMSSMP